MGNTTKEPAMKKTILFSILTALLFITGCTTLSTQKQRPQVPERIPGKYAFQAIRIEVPMNEEGTPSSPLAPSDEIEEMLKNPKAILMEFPVVYAAVGETAVNDQTKTISIHEPFEVKTNSNGVIEIAYRDRTVKVGKYTSLTIKTVEKDNVSLDLWFYEKSLNGTQEYAVAPATKTQKSVTASLTLFKKTEVKTSVSIAPSLWFPMGGLIKDKDGKFSSEEKKGPQIGSSKVFSFIRILPPKEMNFEH